MFPKLSFYFQMAEQEVEQATQELEQCQVEDEENPNYKPPAPKALDEMINQDQDDESLVKYKQALLGQGSAAIIHGESVVKFEDYC